MVVINKNVVNTAGHVIIEFICNFYVIGICNIKNNKSVFTIGCPFSSDDCYTTIFGYFHVIYGSSIHSYCVNNMHFGWVSNIPKISFTIGAPCAGSSKIFADMFTDTGPYPEVRCVHILHSAMTHNGNLFPHIPWYHLHGFSGRVTAGLCHHRKNTRCFSNKLSFLIDQG